ncbi:hypothetical protein KbCgl_23170 [Corynebacterium glutamicum]|nr:hypothetical protein KbCgl_23170 [Corynebacterium glutamicum]
MLLRERNDGLNDLAARGIRESIIDVLQRVGAHELLDRELALAPQMDQVRDEILRNGVALDDRLELPTADQ